MTPADRGGLAAGSRPLAARIRTDLAGRGSTIAITGAQGTIEPSGLSPEAAAWVVSLLRPLAGDLRLCGSFEDPGEVDLVVDVSETAAGALFARRRKTPVVRLLPRAVDRPWMRLKREWLGGVDLVQFVGAGDDREAALVLAAVRTALAVPRAERRIASGEASLRTTRVLWVEGDSRRRSFLDGLLRGRCLSIVVTDAELHLRDPPWSFRGGLVLVVCSRLAATLFASMGTGPEVAGRIVCLVDGTAQDPDLPTEALDCVRGGWADVSALPRDQVLMAIEGVLERRLPLALAMAEVRETGA